MRLPQSLAVVCALSVAALACDTSTSTGPGNPRTGNRDASTSSTADSGVVTHPDAGPAMADTGVDLTRDPTCTSGEWVVEVSGSVQTAAGAPVPNAKAQLCMRLAGSGRLLCLRPVDVLPDGRFAVSVPEDVRCLDQATFRILDPDADLASMYCHVDLPSGASLLNVATPYKLYPTTRATSIPPAGDEMTARKVTFADGLEIEIVPFNFFAGGEGYAALAASRLPATTDLCFVDNATELSAIYAFSPEGSVIGTPFSIRIPNTEGRPAGAAVELFELGGLGCALADGSEIPEAAWVKFGTGTVDASGSFIEATGMNGITCLTWLGVGK